MRGETSHPECGLVTISVLGCPVKTPKLTGKETGSGKLLGETALITLPGKRGSLSLAGAKHGRPALAGQVDRGTLSTVWNSELRASLASRMCPSDFWKLSAFNMRPGPQGSTWNRPGYNYRFILPTETKSKSSLLPSSKQSLGNSEKLISGEERFS